jgi:hypothetical protein
VLDFVSPFAGSIPCCIAMPTIAALLSGDALTNAAARTQLDVDLGLTRLGLN